MEQPDSILITMSLRILKEGYEGGYRQMIRDWMASDADPTMWMYKMHRLPKQMENIIYVYWVINGKIRWRCKYGGLQPEAKEMWGLNWMLLFDFEKLPRPVEHKGFQGFRYYNSQPI